MHEQTHFRSIQWRIDLARARVLRAQLRDFFDRSLARFDTARLEESMYSGITEAAEMRPNLWTRIRSGIQTPFAARRSDVTETPQRKTTMPKRNLYGEDPVAKKINSATNNSTISPPLPPRNTFGTNSQGGDCSVLIEDDRYETVCSDSNTASFGTFQSPKENMTEWASALESPIGDPQVVRVSFNPNDPDSIVVLESTDVNSPAEDINSPTANESNVDNDSRMPSDDSMSQFGNNINESLYRHLQNVREEFRNSSFRDTKEVTTEEGHSSDPEAFLRSVFRDAQRETIRAALHSQLEGTHAQVDETVDSVFGPSNVFPSGFLEQHMSIGSTMSIPDTTGLSPLASPFAPLANSSPAASNSSFSSDGEDNQTVQEVTDEQALTQQEVSTQDSIPSPLAGVVTPVRPAPPVPASPNQAPAPAVQGIGPIRNKRQKKVWPITSDYNLRSRKNKESDED